MADLLLSYNNKVSMLSVGIILWSFVGIVVGGETSLLLSDGSQQPLTLISGHEEVSTENQVITVESCAMGNSDVYSPSYYCDSCVGKSQYSTCGDRGLNGRSFCSYDYTGAPICLQNQYCSDITKSCSTHSNCLSDEACAVAGCSSGYYCHKRCSTTSSPTPAPSPATAPTQCSSCNGAAQYSTCGTRGYNDKSFCSYDYTGAPVCMQNDLCSSITRFCSNNNDCYSNEVCGKAACSSSNMCYRRCDSTATPPPAPLPTFAPTRRPTAFPTPAGGGGSEECASCVGKSQYSKCGERGYNDFSFCSYDYTGAWLCLKNGLCSDYTVYCSSHSQCGPGQACARAACSSSYMCYDRCDYGLEGVPTMYPSIAPTKYPTVRPTLKPTQEPTSSPTRKPTAPICESCVGSVKYAQCGSRGLHDYSFCTNDELGGPVCIQNLYCSDVVRACNSTNQCDAGDVCAVSGCTPNTFHCYRRCTSPLSVIPPSPAPTPTSEQSANGADGSGMDETTTTAVYAVIAVGVLVLVVVAACVYAGCSSAAKKQAQVITYAEPANRAGAAPAQIVKIDLPSIPLPSAPPLPSATAQPSTDLVRPKQIELTI